MDVDEAMDVSTINRLLQDVVQAERTLHRELFDTVVKKEQISQRLTSHQVRYHLLRGSDCLLPFCLYFLPLAFGVCVEKPSSEAPLLHYRLCCAEERVRPRFCAVWIEAFALGHSRNERAGERSQRSG